MRPRRLIAATLAAAALTAAEGASPAFATIRGEGRLERGAGPLDLRLTVRNTGDETFSVLRFTGRRGHAFGQPRPSAGECFRSVTAAGPSIFCNNAPVPPGGTMTIDFPAEPRYPDGGGGLLGVQAGLEDTRIHESQVPGPGTPPGQAPQAGRSERVEPVSGTVRIRLPGSRRFVTLRETELVPDGSELDTRNGVARVVVAADRSNRATVSALVSRGIAIVDQNRAAIPTTTLRLSAPLGRRRRGKAATAARRRKRRSLFVQTDGARFRTRGNHAAATASGTAWLTVDRRASTRIAVREGTVVVRDFRARRTVRVTAPDGYTARRNPATRRPTSPGLPPENRTTAPTRPE